MGLLTDTFNGAHKITTFAYMCVCVTEREYCLCVPNSDNCSIVLNGLLSQTDSVTPPSACLKNVCVCKLNQILETNLYLEVSSI